MSCELISLEVCSISYSNTVADLSTMLALMAGRNARQCMSVVENGDVRETIQTLDNALNSKPHSGRITAGRRFYFAGRSSVLPGTPKIELSDSWDLVVSLALSLQD
jgi:hypothetical protein